MHRHEQRQMQGTHWSCPLLLLRLVGPFNELCLRGVNDECSAALPLAEFILQPAPSQEMKSIGALLRELLERPCCTVSHAQVQSIAVRGTITVCIYASSSCPERYNTYNFINGSEAFSI
jgi:hypothetical protein